jgi:hypothetical protein
VGRVSSPFPAPGHRSWVTLACSGLGSRQVGDTRASDSHCDGARGLETRLPTMSHSGDAFPNRGPRHNGSPTLLCPQPGEIRAHCKHASHGSRLRSRSSRTTRPAGSSKTAPFPPGHGRTQLLDTVLGCPLPTMSHSGDAFPNRGPRHNGSPTPTDASHGSRLRSRSSRTTRPAGSSKTAPFPPGHGGISKKERPLWGGKRPG